MLGVSITINILQAGYIGHFIDRSEQTALKGALTVGAKVPSAKSRTFTRRHGASAYKPVYRSWAERILMEALPIAQADGALLLSDEPQRILERLATYPRGTRTSMLQDYEKGKRLEWEALNGAIVELGRRYCLPTPVNENLVTQLLIRQDLSIGHARSG